VRASVGPTEILVDKPTAMALALAAYWVVGMLANFFVSRVNTIITLLRDDELVMAAVMFPSILTTRPHGARIGLTALPLLFVVIGLAVIFGEKLIGFGSLFGVVVLVVPYLHLVYDLRIAIGESVRKERAVKLVRKQVEEGGQAVSELLSVSVVKTSEGLSIVLIKTNTGEEYYAVSDIGSNLKELSDNEVAQLHLTKKSSRRKKTRSSS